jgi:hypothetical protein
LRPLLNFLRNGGASTVRIRANAAAPGERKTGNRSCSRDVSDGLLMALFLRYENRQMKKGEDSTHHKRFMAGKTTGKRDS